MRTYSLQSIVLTIDKWSDLLSTFSWNKLLDKPLADEWSAGQIYMHLIQATGFFLQQAEAALHTTENSDGIASAAAREMFINNSFPDKKLQGPPSNAQTPQPSSIDELKKGMLSIRSKAATLIPEIESAVATGKTAHPGHQYFSAKEWIQYADMHLRHHFRQIEQLL